MPMIIDADTHVDESEITWSFIEDGGRKYAPINVAPSDMSDGAAAQPGGGPIFATRWWMTENKLVPRATRDDAHYPPQESRQLENVQTRLQDMDRMGVDKQVIFPTFFIRYGTSNPAAEAAVTHGYNRWVAEQCALTPQRQGHRVSTNVRRQLGSPTGVVY